MYQQRYYQKGYSDIYKKSRNNTLVQNDQMINYLYNFGIVVGLFVLLIVCFLYSYDTKMRGEHYTGDCLLNLATTYHTDGCLDR